MKVTVIFRAVCGNAKIKTVLLDGIASIDHAAIIAGNLVGSMSIKAGIALYVGEISIDGKNFRMNPAPDYFSEGVTVEIV